MKEDFNNHAFVQELVISLGKNYPTVPRTDVAMHKLLSGMTYGARTANVPLEELRGSCPEYTGFLEEKQLVFNKNGSRYVRIYSIEPRSTASIKAFFRKLKNADPTTYVSLEMLVSLCLACGLGFERISAAVKALCDETLEGKGMRKLLINAAARRLIDFSEIAYIYGTKDGGHEPRYGFYGKFINDSVKLVNNDSDDRDRVIKDTDGMLLDLDGIVSHEEFVGSYFSNIDRCRSAIYDMTACRVFVSDIINVNKGEQSVSGYFNDNGLKNLLPMYTKWQRGEEDAEPEWLLKLAVQMRMDAEDALQIKRMLHIGMKMRFLDHCWNTAVMSLEEFSNNGDMEKLYRSLDVLIDSPDCSVDLAEALMLWNSALNGIDQRGCTEKAARCKSVAAYLAERVLPVIDTTPFFGFDMMKLFYGWMRYGLSVTSEKEMLYDELDKMRLREERADLCPRSYIEGKGCRRVANWYYRFVATVVNGRFCTDTRNVGVPDVYKAEDAVKLREVASALQKLLDCSDGEIPGILQELA